MRRSDKEVKDPKIIQAILQQAPVCRIGMAMDNKPYIVPVNFAAKGSEIYFHSAPAGKKIDCLRQNPNVCVEVDLPGKPVKNDQACHWGMTYQSLIGFGHAYFIDKREAKKEVLALLMKKFAGHDAFTFLPDALDKVCVIGVRLESVTGKQSG